VASGVAKIVETEKAKSEEEIAREREAELNSLQATLDHLSSGEYSNIVLCPV
jgi:hypothetical protein